MTATTTDRIVRHRDIARIDFRVIAQTGSTLCIIPVDGDAADGRWVSIKDVTDVPARNPRTWTIAWRKRTANHFRRANNWAGTWAEAYEMAAAFGELHPDMQVFYTTSAAYEQWQRDEIAAGTLSADRVDDHGNIMVDSGKRIKIRETGVIEAELLDAEVNKVAAEANETSRIRKPGGITIPNPRARGQWFESPAECRAWARKVRVEDPENFAGFLAAARTADERFAAGAER